jgi:hypothetical protein
MSLIVTAWRLTHPSGKPARCDITERDGRWHVLVWHGASIVLSERCGTDDEALGRAQEIWSALVEHGWTEPRH